MEKKFLLKNCLYFTCFCLLTLFFIAARCFQLFFLTDLKTGICYELRTFDFYFILFFVSFLILSFLFFKFVYKPKFYDFSCLRKSKFLSFTSFIVSVVVFVSSFLIIFVTKSNKPFSSPYNIYFFLSGVFFAISLIIFSVCLFGGLDFIRISFMLVFYSAFLWSFVRIFNLIFTDVFLHYSNVEYKLSVVGLVLIFLFFYYFGRLAMNYKGLSSNCGFLTFGLLSVFVVFANVVPKIFLNFYVFSSGLSKELFSNSLFFNRNINIFNFYNFNLVDFFVSLFVLFFIIVFLRSNNMQQQHQK